MGTTHSVVTLLLDFLARLQRLPLTLQIPRLRIPPTDTLNQVTLNQDFSVHSILLIRIEEIENKTRPARVRELCLVVCMLTKSVTMDL